MDNNSTIIPDTSEFPRLIPRSGDDLSLRWITRLAVYALSILAIVWHVYYNFILPVPRLQHTNIHFLFLVPIFYLHSIHFAPEDASEKRENIVSGLFLVVSVVAIVYVYQNFARWQSTGQYLIYEQIDIVVGFSLIVVLTHAAWRAFGRIFALLTLAPFLYAYFGPYFPQSLLSGMLYHSGMGLERFIFINTISRGGVYSDITATVATWVVMFIFFAGIVESYGGMNYILRLGAVAKEKASSGVLQTAIISSMLMGSITGAAVANVATTGSFTIPLMKSEGVRSKTAGAVESIASTGGQYLPPVMGASSFLMADLLGVSYTRVLAAALLPAIAFYALLIVAVHLTAKKHGWLQNSLSSEALGTDAASDGIVEDGGYEAQDAVESTKKPSTSDHLVLSLPFIISAITLLYTLVHLRYNPMMAGTYTILAMIPAALLRSIILHSVSISAIITWARLTVEGCKLGAVNMARLSVVVVPIAILVNTLTQTGFAQQFVYQITSIAGGNLFILLVLTAIACILLGMGIPTLAAYLLVAVFVVSGLTQYGVDPIIAHMFVFYFAVLSTITPPVAVTCAVAASISESKFLDVCLETIRLGAFAFLLPFLFVYNRNLLLWDGPLEAGAAFVVVISSLIPVIIGLVGYNGRRRISVWQRVAYIILGIVIGTATLWV